MGVDLDIAVVAVAAVAPNAADMYGVRSLYAYVIKLLSVSSIQLGAFILCFADPQ